MLFMKYRLYKAVQFSVHSLMNATSRYRSEIKDLLQDDPAPFLLHLILSVC